MARLLPMPEVAAATTEAVLAEWLVAEGAAVSAGEAIATVETEKALVDIEAEADGVLLKLLVLGSAQVEVGSPIAVLGDVGEQVDDLTALLAELGVGAVVEQRARVVEQRAPASAAPVVEQRAQGSVVETPEPLVARTNGRVFASPLARKIAKDNGLTVEDIVGTGPRGRILRRDVERAISSVVEDGAQPSLVDEGTPAPASKPRSSATTYDDIPHTRLRKAIASRLQQSKREAPHFYLRATIRADKLVALRAEINEGATTRVSLNDLIVKAVAAAHVRVPEMNAIWTDDAVRRPHQVDIAIAVATDRGLVTPVVRDVPSLTVTGLAATVQDLAARARDGKLKQDELEGGTISVTNLGMYGVQEFAAIINPPHAAILSVGAVREEPVVEAGVLAVGKVLTVTLSVDHRPVDGVVAAQWLAAFAELVEHPARAMA